MKAKLFGVMKQKLDADVALLIARLVVGYALILFGIFKIQNPMQWMGADSSVPGILQALAALSEFGGGIALIIGLLTRLASFGIACTMVGAVIMHRFVMGDPFVNMSGGGAYTLPAVLLVIALVFMTVGPGKLSLDWKLFGERK